MKGSIFLVLLLVGSLGLTIADFRDDALAATNRYRAKHGARPLVQDAEANRAAQDYANYLAAHNKFQHSGNQKYGENLAASWGSNKSPSQAAVDAVNMWYNEVKDYDYNNPGFSGQTGHFTAVVWKNTRAQGIGVATNHARKYTVVVANYAPPGNFMGQFHENVGRPNWG